MKYHHVGLALPSTQATGFGQPLAPLRLSHVSRSEAVVRSCRKDSTGLEMLCDCEGTQVDSWKLRKILIFCTSEDREHYGGGQFWPQHQVESWCQEAT